MYASSNKNTFSNNILNIDIDKSNSESLSENHNKINENVSENKIENKIEIDKNNVVFKILKTDMPDIYNLYCIDEKKSIIKHSIALIPNIKTSHYLYYSFVSNPNNFGLKVECKYSKIFEKWIPLRFVENEPYNKTIILDIEEKLKNKE